MRGPTTPPRESTNLRVIDFVGGEERLQRVVARDQETGKVDEELASNVEEDEEEVGSEEAKEGVDLGDGGLLLEVDESRILGKLQGRRGQRFEP